jgi:hypothetical protein
VDSDPALAIGAGPAVELVAGELAAGLAVAAEPLGAGLGLGDAPVGAADGSGVACATTVDESASTLATIRSRPPVAPASSVARGAEAAGVSATSTTASRGAAVAAATAASIARAFGGASALPQGRAFSSAAKRGSSGVGCSTAAIVPTELKVAERSASDATATRARRSSFSARRAGTRSLRRFP